jgi:hypothetical protein
MISIGSSVEKSTKAFSEYPVVHLMLNLRRISADSSASACTRSANDTTPCTSDACERKNAARLSASAVSRTVPSAKTTRMSLKVWYVF